MSLFVGVASLRIPKPYAKSPLRTRTCGQVFRTLMEIMPRIATWPNSRGEGTLEYAFTALWTHYEGDPRQSSICARVLGFHRLMILTKGDLVAPWVCSPKDHPECIVLHPAIVETVASTRLWESGEMMRPEFLRTLNALLEGAGDVDRERAG